MNNASAITLAPRPLSLGDLRRIWCARVPLSLAPEARAAIEASAAAVQRTVARGGAASIPASACSPGGIADDQLQTAPAKSDLFALGAQAVMATTNSLAQLIELARRARKGRSAGLHGWLILFILTVLACQAALDKALRARGRFG